MEEVWWNMSCTILVLAKLSTNAYSFSILNAKKCIPAVATGPNSKSVDL